MKQNLCFIVSVERMSLADQLLADLDDGEDEDMDNLVKKEENDEIEEVMEVVQAAGIYDRVTDVAKLMKSEG